MKYPISFLLGKCVLLLRKMYKQKQNEGRLSRRVLFSAMIAGIAVAVVFTITPWNYIPTEVTEDVTVISNMEYGCVGRIPNTE